MGKGHLLSFPPGGGNILQVGVPMKLLGSGMAYDVPIHAMICHRMVTSNHRTAIV